MIAYDLPCFVSNSIHVVFSFYMNSGPYICHINITAVNQQADLSLLGQILSTLLEYAPFLGASGGVTSLSSVLQPKF